LPGSLRSKFLKPVKAKYEDFGPTLASEYLARDEAVEVSKETLGQWLIAAGMRRGKRRRRALCQLRTFLTDVLVALPPQRLLVSTRAAGEPQVRQSRSITRASQTWKVGQQDNQNCPALC